MDVFSTTAEFLDVNCYAVRAEGEDDCVFIDSGFDCAPGLAEIVEEENLVPRAVLLTHGHPDHVLGLTDVLSGGMCRSTSATPTATAWTNPPRR